MDHYPAKLQLLPTMHYNRYRQTHTHTLENPSAFASPSSVGSSAAHRYQSIQQQSSLMWPKCVAGRFANGALRPEPKPTVPDTVQGRKKGKIYEKKKGTNTTRNPAVMTDLMTLFHPCSEGRRNLTDCIRLAIPGMEFRTSVKTSP